MFDWLALDPRTLLLVALLLVMLNAAAMALLLPGLADELKPSARSWGIGIGFQAISGLSFALQSALQAWIPEALLVILAHVAALVGMTFYLRALLQFHGLPFRWPLLLPAVIGGSAIVLVTALGGGLAWRIVFTSLTLSVLLLLAVRTLSGPGPMLPQVSRRVLRLTLCVLLAAVVMRALQAALDPPQALALIDIARGPLVLQLLLMSALPVVGTSAFFAMCSERMRMRWEAAAATDFLTGLANRRSLVEASEEAIREARQTARPLCLAILDIDHFKPLNDRLGHAAGDAALKHFARLLQDACGPTDLAARAGGEEFCVLFRAGGPEPALGMLARLQGQLRQRSWIWQGHAQEFSFSAGVSELGEDDGGFDSLLGRADQALYAAKRQGRDRVVLANPPTGRAAVPVDAPA